MCTETLGKSLGLFPDFFVIRLWIEIVKIFFKGFLQFLCVSAVMDLFVVPFCLKIRYHDVWNKTLTGKHYDMIGLHVYL